MRHCCWARQARTFWREGGTSWLGSVTPLSGGDARTHKPCRCTCPPNPRPNHVWNLVAFPAGFKFSYQLRQRPVHPRKSGGSSPTAPGSTSATAQWHGRQEWRCTWSAWRRATCGGCWPAPSCGSSGRAAAATCSSSSSKTRPSTASCARWRRASAPAPTGSQSRWWWAPPPRTSPPPPRGAPSRPKSGCRAWARRCCWPRAARAIPRWQRRRGPCRGRCPPPSTLASRTPAATSSTLTCPGGRWSSAGRRGCSSRSSSPAGRARRARRCTSCSLRHRSSTRAGPTCPPSRAGAPE
ncbi:MAG: hypothetical protein J3K34DRAFT_409603 [Monoraphidium minutum]|nr:MAG: hypothetical protein J3K34DRAFT_409603 [Monoraphidium minutum]